MYDIHKIVLFSTYICTELINMFILCRNSQKECTYKFLYCYVKIHTYYAYAYVCMLMRKFFCLYERKIKIKLYKIIIFNIYVYLYQISAYHN